ncbi:MAG: propionyl-CoA synthetase [Cohaesibacteraceae bacterium]
MATNAHHSGYRDIYAGWQEDPLAFWARCAQQIDWMTPFDKVFEPDDGVYGRWFPGAVCNTAYNCLDRHVARGRKGQAALIYDRPVTGAKKIYTFEDLRDEVSAFGAVLKNLGVGKGDRVIVYMPMTPEAVIGMLACARIGAVHSVVFGGFAAKELATRIDDARPKAVISASCGIEPNRVVAYKPLLDEEIALSTHKPDFTVIKQREQNPCDLIGGRDHDYDSLMADANARGIDSAPEPMAATDPLYILYTSGTTGVPKGVVRDHGGHMVALNWTMNAIYGVNPGDVYWAASDVGWVVGHSYIVYGPLLAGCATVLYEGKPVGTPDPGAFWRVIEEHKVRVLFTAPTAFRAIKKEDPEGTFMRQYDLSGLKTLFLAGERADPDTIQWAEDQLGVPVVDHWWQTETGWAIAGNTAGLGLLPIKHGSPTVALPGYDVQVIDDAGHPVPAGTLGNIVVKLPLPPGCLPTLWNNDERFKASYLEEFPGYYKTADAGMVDEDGYLFIMARTDDIINVAGHRLSTGGMEEVLASHPAVAEAAVIGVGDALKGQLPAGFVVIKAGVDTPSEVLEKEMIALVREKIGPVAAFKTVMVVDRLPKTRSGKILRGTMRQIADGETYKMPATIDDPVILEEIKGALQQKGYASA